MAVSTDFKTRFPEFETTIVDQYIPILEPVWPSYWGGDSVTVAFSSNRRALQFRLPVPLNVSSVDQRGFKYYVESYFGVAGLDVIEDDAAQILTGL